MENKCFIVSIGSPWNYVGYEWERHVFDDREKAEAYFDKVREEKTKEVVDDNGMLPEEEKDYREEIAENATYDYCEDPEGEWAVSLDEAYKEE